MMVARRTTIRFVLTLSMINIVFAASCTDTVPTLNDLERRARNYAIGGYKEQYINDFYLNNGWYSVKTHGKQYSMPDSTVEPTMNTCGSRSVIYIKGSRPDPLTLKSTPVDAIACLKDRFSDCIRQINIRIRKCGDDIQYYLKQSDDQSAYCFDPPELQSVKADGIAQPPKNIDLGKIVVNPELKFNTKYAASKEEYREPMLEFTCSFKLEDNYFYEVYWYIDGRVLTKFGPFEKDKSLLTVLDEETLIKNNVTMGFMINCGVRMRATLHGMASPLNTSADFYAGIKLINSQVYMNKSSTATLNMKLTVPLGCEYFISDVKTDPCHVGLRMYDPRGNLNSCQTTTPTSGKTGYILQKGYSRKCGQELQALKEGEFWNSSAVFSFNVTTMDHTYYDYEDFRVGWRVDSGHIHKIWQNYQPPYATVLVTNNKDYQKKTCYSHVDPHMKTADGYYYEHQFAETSILYRNSKYGIEVQQKVHLCNGNHAWCACGIAIMAGADVFMINRCNPNLPFVDFLSCRDGGILRIDQQSTLFKVYTPIGTTISIQLLNGYYLNSMNIDIVMSPKDVENTEGLCGHFDGTDKTNDLKHRDGTEEKIRNGGEYTNHHPLFSKSWKVTEDEDLFASPIKRQLKKWEDQRPLYCICALAKQNAANPSVQQITTEAVCEPTQYASCQIYKLFTEKKCRKFTNRKRSVHLKHEREIERLLKLANKEANDDTVQIRKRDSPENITEAKARGVCDTAIRGSLAVSKFSNHTSGENPAAVVDQCTFDVQAGNDASLAEVQVEAMNSIVKTMFEKDIAYVENNTADVQFFKENTCPNNCSNVGTCSADGTCKCTDHFHGRDCSIDDRHPLKINDIEGGGICNLTDGDDCTCFYFRTVNLLPNFKCKVSGIKTYVTNDTSQISPSVGTGEQEDMFTGICCVPVQQRSRRSVDGSKNVFTTRYDISVSNDGVHFGTISSMTVFDSTCQSLRHDANDVSVVLKDGFCFIDSMCVHDGHTQIQDSKFVCIVDSDKYSWTSVDTTENGNTNLIIGICVGLPVTMVTMVVIAVVIKFKVVPSLRQKKSVGDSFVQLKHN